MEKIVLTIDSPKQRVAKCLKCCVYIGLHCSKSSFTNEKRELPFWPQNLAYWRGKQHRKFVFWQPIMAATNLLSYASENKFSDQQIWGSSWPLTNLHWIFLFLPQLMAVCRHRPATKHSFQMTQALVTCKGCNKGCLSVCLSVYLLSKASGSKYMQLFQKSWTLRI